MTELGPTERRLLRALRASDEPSDGDRARVRARLLRRLAAASGVASALATTAANAPGAAAAAGAAGGVPAAAATATTVAGWAAGSWKIGAAIVAVVGAAGGAAWIAAAPVPDNPVLPAPQAPEGAADRDRPAPAHEPRPEAPSKDELAPSPAAQTSRPARARSAQAPVSSERPADLEAELALLESAQRALKQGDSERALSALDQHATDHPGGALSSERAGIRAVALCQSQKLEAGQREARRFLAKNPKSPLAARVRAACLSAK